MSEGAASRVDRRFNHRQMRDWELVSRSPASNLWCPRDFSAKAVARRAWNAIIEDRLFGHAAELGFYFLFALFPALVCASVVLGMVARSAHLFYDSLLHYLAVVIPPSALATVLQTFNQTAAASSSGKLTFGIVITVWTASVGVSAVQDTLNVVYRVVDRRSYLRARIEAIGLTMVLIATVSLCLASLAGGAAVATWAHLRVADPMLRGAIDILACVCGWAMAAGFLALSFAVTYHWAPGLRRSQWRWFTPGMAAGIAGWLLASGGLRIYLHFFNSYTVIYGSLGAVIILLTWFYLTGLMLLIGAVIDSEIEAAVVNPGIFEDTLPSNALAPTA